MYQAVPDSKGKAGGYGFSSDIPKASRTQPKQNK